MSRLNLVERLKRSWAIFKASAAILRSDSKLVVLPLLGGLVTLLVVAAFGAGAYFTLSETVDATGTSYEPSGLTYAVGVVGYLCITVVATFFTAALVWGAHERLTGSTPSVGSALGGASRRLPQIIGWAAVAATVGLVLQVIADRGFLGRMVATLLSFGWNVLTFLTIPIVVVEGRGPFASLQRSTTLFKDTWGDNLIAQLGFGWIGSLLVLPGVLLAIGVGLAVPLVGIAVGVVWVVVVSLALSALNGIYRAALYHFATTGEVPDGFPAQAMTDAFASRSGARSLLG